MTFTAKLRNKETFIENCSVLDPRYISNKKQVLKQFSEFCQINYKESDEEVLDELMKQNQDERIFNACDVIQLFINYLSKKVKPQTVKAYLTHVYGYFNYRGIKISSLDRKSIRYPREIKEEKLLMNTINELVIWKNLDFFIKQLDERAKTCRECGYKYSEIPIDNGKYLGNNEPTLVNFFFYH